MPVVAVALTVVLPTMGPTTTTTTTTLMQRVNVRSVAASIR